jgi:hypothetical protein
MSMRQLFMEHPRSVGESYLEHQRRALNFGTALLVAGVACLLHALVPALFPTTGSRTVSRLHDRMVIHRTPVLRAMPARLPASEETIEPPPGGFWPA